MDQITQLLYLVREDGNIMINVDINQMTSKDFIVYGTPLTR